ncbi:MAG: NBR1-Ig-like domain-containing protein [Bacteroidota bacterium]
MKRFLFIGILFFAVAVSAQNDAQFVSQSDIQTINAGESFNYSVTFKNTGTTTWTSGSLYRLGAQAPQDNRIWLNGTNRISLPDDVPPGEEVTFSTTLTAPVGEGVYVIQWRMVQDGVEWFGEESEIIPYVNYSNPNTIFTYTRSSAGSSVESYDEAMAVACLQGVINREKPIVYLFEGSGKRRPRYWFNIISSEGRWLSGRETIELNCIESLFVLAKDKIKGAVIWDSDVAASINVATTIAGVEDALVFSPEYANRNLAAWGLPVIKDLRGMFTGSETGSAKNDAYRWAVREYLSQGECSNHLLCLYEDSYLTRERGDIGYVVTRDWAVKNRSFVYDLSPWGDEVPLDDPEQPLGTDLATYKILLEEVLKQTAGNMMTEVAGFFSFKKYSNVPGHPSSHDPVPTEWETVYLISPYNCYQNTVASSCWNQTFHSQAPIGNLKQHRPADTLSLEKEKTYICILMADYDSGTPLYDFLVDYWSDPTRGDIPLLWGINPNLIETYPDLISYYYETHTANDYFAADASAAGYMNPNRIREEYIPLFIDHNKKFYEQLDMTISPMVLDWDEPTSAVKDAFTQFSPDGFATIVMDLHHTGGEAPDPHIWEGMPVTNLINVVGQISDNNAAADAMSRAIPAVYPGKESFHMFRIVWSWPSQVIDALNILKSKRSDLDIEVVDPYNFFKLFKDSYSTTAVLDIESDQSVICYQDADAEILSVKAACTLKRVVLYSVTGSVVKVVNSDFDSISIDDLQSGTLFLVKIYLNQGTVVKKILKL